MLFKSTIPSLLCSEQNSTLLLPSAPKADRRRRHLAATVVAAPLSSSPPSPRCLSFLYAAVFCMICVTRLCITFTAVPVVRLVVPGRGLGDYRRGRRRTRLDALIPRLLRTVFFSQQSRPIEETRPDSSAKNQSTTARAYHTPQPAHVLQDPSAKNTPGSHAKRLTYTLSACHISSTMVVVRCTWRAVCTAGIMFWWPTVLEAMSIAVTSYYDELCTNVTGVKTERASLCA